MENSSRALEDRRQRAREAAADVEGVVWPDMVGRGEDDPVEAAIETATRVQITPEIIEAARQGWLAAEGSWTEHPGPRQVGRLRAAFEAAGFEVES